MKLRVLNMGRGGEKNGDDVGQGLQNNRYVMNKFSDTMYSMKTKLITWYCLRKFS
jgi:hypothetical protein